MGELKQLTSYVRTFLMVQSADSKTGAVGAAPKLNLSLGGGALSSTNAVIAELGVGYYTASLTSTDTRTLGDLAFHFTGTSADPTDFIDQVRVNILGDTLPANVTQYNGSAISAPQTAGVPDVNMRNIANAPVSTTTTQLGVGVVNVGGAASQGAAGYVGIDWSKVNAPTTVLALTQTTINSSQSVITSAPVTVGANNDKTGYGLSAAERASSWSTVYSESYPLFHGVPSPYAAVLLGLQMMMEKTVSNTSVNVLKSDGSTLAASFTLDSTSPTKISRAA